MDSAATATSGATVTGSFEKLFVSTMRFSGAATLYGVQQFEGAVTIFQGGEGLTKQLDRFGTTVNSLTQCLVDEFSPGKKEALESISDLTNQVVRQSLEGLSLFDPRLYLRLTNNVVQKSSETLANWFSKKEAAPAEEPKLAAEVLAR